jgi:glutamate 5-kinase
MTLVVKLGSSIVAADDGSLRADVLDGVCDQVAELVRQGRSVVMVTSGAVARGMWLMKLPLRPRVIDELQAASAVGQGDLFRAYESRLAGHGIRAAQVLLTASDIWNRGTYLNAQHTLRRLINWEVVPVINENDTTATDEITVGDNDFLAAQVSLLVDASQLVLLTNTEGLYTADPRHDPRAELVREVSSAEQLAELSIDDRTSVFGSGGMRSKTRAAAMASYAGVETVICNGTRPGTLIEAVGGAEIGTRFPARERSESAFKLWLRFAKPSQGEIEIDAGAVKALREKGSSLLPVGITAVRGEFAAGDGVEVRHNGELIGKGIVECSAEDLDAIKGTELNQAAIELKERLNSRDDIEEAIHRDRFVLY